MTDRGPPVTITEEMVKSIGELVIPTYKVLLERHTIDNETNPHLQAYRGTKTRIHERFQERLGDQFRSQITEEQNKYLWHLTDKIVHAMGVTESGDR